MYQPSALNTLTPAFTHTLNASANTPSGAAHNTQRTMVTMTSAERLEQVDGLGPPARFDASQREPEEQRAHHQRQHRALRGRRDGIARNDRGESAAANPAAAGSAASGVPMAALSDAMSSGSRGSSES